MTRFEADAADERAALLAEAIAAHRKRSSEGARFEADDGPVVVYADRRVRLACDDQERERLEALLEEFSVFKIAQPDTRKADGETVFVSAIADPKHAADFLEAVFRQVYDLPEDYRLWVTEI